MKEYKEAISITLSKDLIDLVKQTANAKELSVSAFIRLALIDYLNSEREKIERKENN